MYLRQLLLEIHQSDEVGHTDSRHRLYGGYLGRTHDIPCGLLRRCEPRQRTFTHLHYPAQRVPAGLCRLPIDWLYHFSAVLHPVVAGSSDIAHVIT